MRCKNCNKEISEFEIFCEDCKNEMKKISSKKDVKELENLIDEHKNINDLESTKELVNLNTLVEDELKKENTIEELFKDENIKKDLDTSISDEIKHNNKKNLIIITSIVAFLVLTIVLVLVFFKTPEKSIEEEKIIIDYEKVIKEYGEDIEKIVGDYINQNEEVPTWQQVSELITYKKYNVVCEVHNIYSDGSIYLNSCKVDNKKIKYSYGEEKEETKEGKKIEIYKLFYGEEYYGYLNYNDNGSSLVGTVTCKTEACEYVNAYDKYVLIKEEGLHYLYNYENNSMEFGPFDVNKEYTYSYNMLSNNNQLYGILYNEDNKNNIYNVNTGKTLKNIKGTLVVGELYFDTSIIYKYNYVVFNNNGKNEFINLKTGNVSYTINEKLGTFTEDKNNKIVYITSYTTDYNKFKIYNSNGKLLFDGKEFTKFLVGSNSLFVATENTFKVYDNSLKLKTTSKSYDEILGLYEDFVVVTKNSDLKILSIEDVELATFEGVWDNEKYIFHSVLSGWYTENDKNGIYLVVENKEIPTGTKGSGLEYYYIPNTKETGVIETNGVGGYAKPVLYLYPKTNIDVTVTFANPNMLTTTYPKFKNKWSVSAYPNGDLYDSKGNYYYALYWEEEQNHNIDFSEGFYVTKENAIEFLEEKLSIIGLNAKERNEFIMYWLPILEKNEKSLVYFELTEEREKYNKLIINPKPDSILRMAIHVKKVNKKTSIKEEKLTTFNRVGFTAVEWGGVIY